MTGAGTAVGAVHVNRALYAPGAGNFVISVGAFVVIGILSPMMQGLALTKSGAGFVLTIFALACAVAWSFMVPQQARPITLGPQYQGLLLALNASAIYLGASIGATIGGAPLMVWSYAALGPVAAAVALLSLLSVVLAARLRG